jgi:hypothetical protein
MAQKTKQKRKKQPMQITISPEMKAKAKRIAKREHRSVSSLFEYLISLEWKKFKGENKPPDPRTDSGIYHLGGSIITP